MRDDKSLLIFDLDGTLIDSVPDLAAAVNATLVDLGRAPFDETTIRNWVGNGATMLVARALSGAMTVDDTLPDTALQDALARFFDHYRAHTCERTQAYAGVSEGLQALKHAGYTLSMVTNKPFEFIAPIVQAMGWQGILAVTLGGDSLPTKKPDPAPLLHVCQQLGIASKHAYMIGDSKNDILAGKQAHIDTLGLSYGYNYGQDIRTQQPTAAFDSFGELVAFLL